MSERKPNQVVTFARIDDNTVEKTTVETVTTTEKITIMNLQDRKIKMIADIEANQKQILVFQAEIENIDAEILEIQNIQ